ELYELTLKNFGYDPCQGITHDSNYYRTKKGSKTSQVLPQAKTSTFSPKVEKWMTACEHLNGLRMVLEMGEWWASIQIGYRAIKVAPFDHYVWLEFFKILKKQLKKKVFPKDKFR
ncbi:MAG: hypothetical protein OET79_13270, partial [Nitrospirota bacterium]|nr:hypothetical protein [Nitrospirota bacterium]